MSHHRTYRWLVASGLGAVVAYLCGGIPLLTVYGLVFLLGRGLHMPCAPPGLRQAPWGWAVPCSQWHSSAPLGEKLSLSTIDVRTAFALLDAPWGLPAVLSQFFFEAF